MFNFSEPDVPQISADEVLHVINNNDNVTLLDVRTHGEYLRGKIKNSINLPVDEVSKKIASVIPDKQTKIYVYCLSGSRSVHAVDTMLKLGYTDVHNVTNGLLAWRAKQFPLEK